MDSKAVFSGGDRLSTICDGVLGHILSFLPAAEAARAASLSRRWRHVFAAVHSLSFDEPERNHVDGYNESWSPNWGPRIEPDFVPAQPFVNAVGAALHGRHRGPRAPPAAPLRALRVAFDEFGPGDTASKPSVDGWLSYALHQAGDELHVDLRFGHQPICDRTYTLRRRHGPDTKEGDEEFFFPHAMDRDSDHDDDDDDMEEDTASSSCPPGVDEYVVPGSLFSCAALRTLCLGSCRLDPPAAVSLPSLDTLVLIGVTDGNAAVKRLVSSCPRLADLTLEACNNVTTLSTPGTRLRRLALRCCHGLAAVVAADLSELRAFEYRGALPLASFRRTRHGPFKITSCSLDFCGEEASGPAALASLRDFLHLFAGTTHLHLKSARLGAGVGHVAFSSAPAFPGFTALRELELTGILPDDDTAVIARVTRILKSTPSLETLSLFFLPEPQEKKDDSYYCHKKEELLNEHRLRYDHYTVLAVPDGVEIPCLRERMREINFVHYQGAIAQRMLAKFLLHGAPIVDKVCCVFAKGPLLIQAKLMEEIRGWVMNKSANMMFF